MNGKVVDLSTVPRAIEAGLAYVTEDRKSLGLVLEDSIAHNTTLAHLRGISQRGVIDEVREFKVADDYRRRLGTRCSGVQQQVVNLSGGNQQKVVLAKWLFAEPSLLILDEPTRGIDVGAKQEIYAEIDKLAQAGLAVVMVSSELPEVLGLSDRILVLHEGQITGEFTRANATPEAVMACATGQAVHA
jgi:putative multiple sugar transport system ATP-binding protein